MKIGIFDSGLGGLLITKAIRKKMPKYDYVYLGDTKRVPYGNRSSEAVYEFTKEGVNYLFEKENCGLIILACNTASARALRRLQREYLPKKYPTRKILGVLIPAAEETQGFLRVGVLATSGTVVSGSFPKEIKKVDKRIKVFQIPAPMLVPLVEAGETVLAKEFLKKYLKPLLAKKVEKVILGCTHYPFYKKEIKKYVSVISQDEVIPKKLLQYLKKHPELKLSQEGKLKILITDLTQNTKEFSKKWFGETVKPKLIRF